MVHHHEVLASLKKHVSYLPDVIHREIADGMVSDGLADSGNGGEVRASAAPHEGWTRLQTVQAAASNPDTARLFREVRATAARMGYELPSSGFVDPRALDAAIKGQPTDQKFLLKGMLADHRLRLIP
ncbi:MAG TPA: hypothetical protein VH558_02275 [Pseudolabrys sp.]|jgi:hypothetical protein